MLTLHWKIVVFSLIYLKHLIEFGMTVSFINLTVMELTVTSLNLLSSFLNSRCQRVAFNGQFSVWKSVTAGVPQDSVLGPLFFLISINYLPLGLTTDVKLFADDASFFSVVNHASVSISSSCNDCEWKHELEISIGKRLLTQILLNKQKRLFFQQQQQQKSPCFYPSLFFSNSLIDPAASQKHLGLIVDQKLTFQHHVNKK